MNDRNQELETRILLLKAYLNKMPALSPTVDKVLKTCRDINTSPGDLSKIISMDPVLTGKILMLINSAYYGMPQKVTSLVRAIIMLGINTVKNLVLSTVVLNNLKSQKKQTALDMNKFWHHSLGVGVISKLIAKKRDIGDRDLEEYFIAGLLHDIGKIPMNNAFEEYRIAVEESLEKEKPLNDMEKEILKIDHTQVGKLIMKKWSLGGGIGDTITRHHSVPSYTGDYKDILFTVALADYQANILKIGASGNAFPRDLDNDILHYLDVRYEDIEELNDTVNDEIDKAKIFLEISR